MSHSWKYMPILKWKLGERGALKNLSDAQWEGLIPLLELPMIEATPDRAGLREALPTYLAKRSKEMVATFPEHVPLVVDTRYCSPGYGRQVNLLGVICKNLQKLTEKPVIPVISESLVDTADELGEGLKDFDEVVLRIAVDTVSEAQLSDLVKSAVTAGLRKRGLHLLLDQYSIVGAQPLSRLAVVTSYVDHALTLGCASVTLAGGSFPVNLVGFKQGADQVLPRVEWKIWEALQKSGGYEALRFSDYAVSNPAPLPDIDPKQVNPSVAIRYACQDHWRLLKAGGFKGGKPNQYRNLCKLLLGDPIYSGSSFSFGDACYEKAATGASGNGNPSSWRRDATSHHLVLTRQAL